MDNINILNLSGGSTKIKAIHESTKVLILEKNYKPNIITGVSSGALLSVPIALGLHPDLDMLLKDINIKDIFNKNPLTKNNLPTKFSIVRAGIGLLTSKEYASLGTMKPLEEKLRKLITPQVFSIYKERVLKEEAPKVYIGVFSLYHKRNYIIPIHELEDYELYIKYTIASASIPIAAQPIKIGNDYFVDGGVSDHSIGGKVVKKYFEEGYKINNVISIWTRPIEDYDPFKVETVENFNIENIFKVGTIIGESLLEGISYSDEESYENFYKSNNIKSYNIHFPKITKGIYDTDSYRLDKLTSKTIKLTRQLTI